MYDYILKGTIIDGIHETPVENGLVAIEGNTIAYVGPAEGFSIPEGIPVYEGKTILPGFIDCHIHLSGEEDACDGAAFGDTLLAGAYQCGPLIDSGLTSVRDMSEQGTYLSRAQKKGLIRAPRIMPGGKCLSVTAGHGDDGHNMTKRRRSTKRPPLAFSATAPPNVCRPSASSSARVRNLSKFSPPAACPPPLTA